ncbi:MAG: 1-acyl-sn-glycerol-3-phosphate acyltransferase [Phycisphaerales bacterium]|nr:MAG: 1-acyl-sn-glycerol-3-phosphate acyltransferase [Phycisphaerales bacterium]
MTAEPLSWRPVPAVTPVADWPGWAPMLAVVVLIAAAAIGLAIRLSASPYRLPLALCSILNKWLAIVWYRLRREGPCTVPRAGPVIVVANHTSSADPLVVIAAACHRRIPSYMVAKEFSRIPFFHHFTDLIDCIPVRRDGRDVEATKAAIRHLRAGGALGIFIEGRIPAPGEAAKPKDGPAMLALRTGATVIPAHIRGMKRSSSVAWSFFQRHRARVRFGPPVDLSAFATSHDRSTVHLATQRIHEAIERLAPGEPRPRDDVANRHNPMPPA